jgi:hypothetical protein
MRLNIASSSLKRLEFLKDCQQPAQSSAKTMTLPLRQPEAKNSVSNNNLGAGTQKNFSQVGGSHNKQFNADTINYHGEHDP